MPPELWQRASELYIRIYEQITGTKFVPGEQPAQERLLRNLEGWL